MIILSDWDRIGDGYRMVLKMSVNDSIDDLPSANRPMNPEFFAVSKEYGIPADGSVVIENEKPTFVYKDGKWKNAVEGGGEIKAGYINITKNGQHHYLCDIDEALGAIEGNNMILVDSGTHKALIVGISVSMGTMSCSIPIDEASGEFNIKANSKINFTENGESINNGDKITKLFDFLLTKNIYPIYTLYTV